MALYSCLEVPRVNSEYGLLSDYSVYCFGYLLSFVLPLLPGLATSDSVIQDQGKLGQQTGLCVTFFIDDRIFFFFKSKEQFSSTVFIISHC